MSGINPFLANLLLQKSITDLGDSIDETTFKNAAEAKTAIKDGLKYAVGGAVVAGLSYLGFDSHIFGYGLTSLPELLTILAGVGGTAVGLTGALTSLQASGALSEIKEKENDAAGHKEPTLQPTGPDMGQKTTLSPHHPSPTAGHHLDYAEIKAGSAAGEPQKAAPSQGTQADHTHTPKAKPGGFDL